MIRALLGHSKYWRMLSGEYPINIDIGDVTNTHITSCMRIHRLSKERSFSELKKRKATRNTKKIIFPRVIIVARSVRNFERKDAKRNTSERNIPI